MADYSDDYSGGSYGGGGEIFPGLPGDPGGGIIKPQLPPDLPLTQMQVDEGGNLVVAYGKHAVAGHLVEYDYNAGPPPILRFIAALGEGPWNGVVKAYYAGEEMNASTNFSNPGYKFHPGTFSTGTSDANQGTPLFFPTSPTYSGTAYMEVRLNQDQSVEERPDKFVGIFECLKVADYDDDGVEIDAGSYSNNPARVAADVLKRAGLLDRINWTNWNLWKDYCDETISWGSRTIKRFECNLALIEPTNIVDALQFITTTSCTFWQDDGSEITFLPVMDVDASGIYSAFYDETNIRDLNLIASDQRVLPTGYVARFRDTDSDYMEEVTVEYFDEDLESERGGSNRVEIQLPPMNRSQAERICYWRMQLDGISSAEVEFISFADTGAILPGDVVSVFHEAIMDYDIPESSPYAGIVTETEDLSEDAGPGIRRVRVKLLLTTPYSDTAHTVPPSV